MIELIELKKEIEKLRDELYLTVENYGIQNEYSIAVSQNLDEKIVAYQRLKKRETRG